MHTGYEALCDTSAGRARSGRFEKIGSHWGGPVKISQFVMTGEAVSHLLDVLLLVAADGSILDANEAALSCYGYPHTQMLAMNIRDVRGLDFEIHSVAQTGQAHSVGVMFETENVRSDGAVFPVLVWSAPVIVNSEPATLEVIHDITARKRMEQRLLDALTSVTDLVGTVSEMRDPYTAGHQRRVAGLAVAIALDLGMAQGEIGDLRTAALLHDVGNMSVPAEILTKPGVLSSVEFSLVQEHVDAGFRVLTSARVSGPIPEIVHQHHERMDGSGYPRGLMGADLLECSKVLMVADVVEAMSSHRPYRPALGIDAAVSEIEAGAGTLFDSRVVESCARVVRAPGFTLWQAGD